MEWYEGLLTHVSLPHVLESSLARENDWWIFLFRDALFPFLISSLILWHQVLINAHEFSELHITIEIPFLTSSRRCIAVLCCAVHLRDLLLIVLLELNMFTYSGET